MDGSEVASVSMEEANINMLLPAEMLERIFHLLPPHSLKTALLVCRLWLEVGESPGLWAWVSLAWVTRKNPGVLDVRRLRAVRQLGVGPVSEELLEAVARHQGLEVMEVHADLSSVEPGVLARAVTGVKEARLAYTRLTGPQAAEICTAVCRGSKLRVLDISNNNLSCVEPSLLGCAVALLEEVSMYGTCLTRQQAEAVFAAIGGGGTLRKLNMAGTGDLSLVEPGLLARAVNRLEEVDMRGTRLTGQQVGEVLAKSTRLRRLLLEGRGTGMDRGPVAEARMVIQQLAVED